MEHWNGTRPHVNGRAGEPAAATMTLPPGTRITLFLLAGALPMLCAEVLSGAPLLWFLSAWGWRVTFPRYMVHLVFFFSLAVLFRHTSLTTLYLWGGDLRDVRIMDHQGDLGRLYRVVTVIGTGYGFVPVEFLIIVHFWHPVISFLQK
jgi:hypothetical protein